MHNPMNEPRYCGIPTFMSTPHVTDLNNLDIALVGVPYDGAVEARSGTRQGPRQIRDMSSMMRTIHHVSSIKAIRKVFNNGNVDDPTIYNPVFSMQAQASTQTGVITDTIRGIVDRVTSDNKDNGWYASYCRDLVSTQPLTIKTSIQLNSEPIQESFHVSY